MITNITRKKTLAKHAKVLRSIFGKAIGLMFSKRIRDTGYVFIFSSPRRMDLHMFFVFFPIDVLFLDKEMKVVEIKQSLKPFALYYSKEKTMYVIELPEDTVNKSGTSLGDTIRWD